MALVGPHVSSATLFTFRAYLAMFLALLVPTAVSLIRSSLAMG